MAPIALDTTTTAPAPAHPVVKPVIRDYFGKPVDQPLVFLPPANAQARYAKAGIDISKGYPYYPNRPEFIQDVENVRTDIRADKPYVDPATRADPQKKALFAAVKEVRHLTAHIGTELVGVQLAELNDKQRDELALLIAERVVVFVRDQDLSPQKQLELGLYLGDGHVERHPSVAQVPIEGGGITLVWSKAANGNTPINIGFRTTNAPGYYGWHSDLVHEPFPPAYTSLLQDTVPEFGGDTLWASGYAAYDKLSPKFRTLIDGLNAVYRSSHTYADRDDPSGPKRHVLRTHPLVRTIPATGQKVLFVNRAMTVGIEGLDKTESDAILNVIYDVYERNTDIQVRWKWTPGSTALWDNRAAIHTVSFDYAPDAQERHGTRVSSLGEKPYFDPKSQSQRQALQLDV